MKKRAALFMMVMILAVTMMPSGVYAASSGSKPGKVKVTIAKLNYQMITVTWKKAKKAKKYEVYAKAGSKSWKKAATVKANGKSKQTYRIKNCKWNTKYRIKVRAVNGKKKGKWSSVWGGRTRKKTTIERELNKNSSTKKYLEDLGRDLSDDTYKTTVSVSGNTINIKMQFIGETYDFSGCLDEARTTMNEKFLTASYKKQMKSQIQDFENRTGFHDASFRVIIYDSVGNLLFDHTYRR